MKSYNAGSDDILEELKKTLEKDTGKKVVSFSDFERSAAGELRILVTFNDYSNLLAGVSARTIDGKLEVRIKGNFL